MQNALDIARFFIVKAYEDGREAEMTNMKLQKLLYYAQSLHLALYEEPLFDAEIQAWRYGPVCPPAYSYYSEFEANQLPVPDSGLVENLPQNTRLLLEEVWEYFGAYHAYFLSDMTHLEFPWKRARKGLPPHVSSTASIALSDMQLLGQQKLEEIEHEHPAYTPIITRLLEQAFSSAQPEYVKQGEVRDWLSLLLD